MPGRPSQHGARDHIVVTVVAEVAEVVVEVRRTGVGEPWREAAAVHVGHGKGRTVVDGLKPATSYDVRASTSSRFVEVALLPRTLRLALCVASPSLLLAHTEQHSASCSMGSSRISRSLYCRGVYTDRTTTPTTHSRATHVGCLCLSLNFQYFPLSRKLIDDKVRYT